MGIEKPKYMVSTRCFTYNQAPYIEDALHGFAMQDTTFPVVYIIVDDASTDGEQEIIKKWVDINLESVNSDGYWASKPYGLLAEGLLKGKKNLTFVFLLLSENHYTKEKKPLKLKYMEEWNENAKYFATCEGDDYWIHPDKLQRQIDFLEAHPNHSLCFHAHSSLRSDGTKRECFRYKEDVEDCPMGDMILGGGGFMATASMVYVKELKDNLPEWARKAPIGDAPTMLVLAERGKVGYIHEVMSCYRVAAPGSWTVRISRDRKKRKQLHKEMIQWIKGFDMWTNKAYHPYVRKALFKLKMHYYLKTIPFVPRIIDFLKIRGL